METENTSTISDTDLLRKRRTFAQKRSLSEYAVSLPQQPKDILGIHPTDDKFRFFKKGRDFQPKKAKHHFTDDELRVLETYESAAILPSRTEVYKNWLQNEPPRGGIESWVILCLVGVITGALAFIMKLLCEKFQIFYNPFITTVLDSGATLHLWMYYSCMSCGFSALSAIVVVYFCPFAAGSGLPEIIGILNGCVVRNVMSFRTLVCKLLSVIFTVLSSLPVGFEGPMVHIGAMVGACMAKPMQMFYSGNVASGKDHERNCGGSCLSRLCRYRDCQERYSLICVGAASGVASAFNAPISGLTFAMEEISSHWSKSQTWRTFVCCILARSTSELLHSLVSTMESSERNDGIFNILQLSESALFDMKKTLNLNLLIFIPACLIGAFGGLLGAIFIFVHLKASKLRRKVFACMKNPSIVNLVKVFEVVLLAFIFSAVIMAFVPYITCKSVHHEQAMRAHGRKSLILRSFKCNETIETTFLNGKIVQSGQFHEGATLLFGSWEQMIRNLLSRKTPQYFSVPVLSLCFLIFWILSSWTSMTNIASGLLIPQLAIGALYGRIFGESLFNFVSQYNPDMKDGSEWEWVDPGAFALMGAASFLSGTSRLPITTCIMMVEMTNDISMTLLIMLCVMLSKFVGDLLTHSIYHAALEFKCIPYLESDLKLYVNDRKVSLELFAVSDVMHVPVDYVKVHESVKVLANLLLETNHGAFPVVESYNGLDKIYLGVITRLELTILLTKTERFDPKELGREDMDRIRISYPEYSSTKLKDSTAANAILNRYSSNIIYTHVYVNLLPYTNTSTPTVPTNFSLHRAYSMFTTMGLRHLVVTDKLNQVAGMITRKNLMGFAIEEKVKAVMRIKKRCVSENSQVGLDMQDDIHVAIQSTVLMEENEDLTNHRECSKNDEMMDVESS